MSKWKEQKAEDAKRENKKKVPSLDELEKGTLSELEELQEGFRDRAEKENQRFYEVTNSDYYFVVCFSNKEQLEEFCDSFGLDSDEIYMDGRDFAKKINRALKTPDACFPKIQPFNKDYLKRAQSL